MFWCCFCVSFVFFRLFCASEFVFGGVWVCFCTWVYEFECGACVWFVVFGGVRGAEPPCDLVLNRRLETLSWPFLNSARRVTPIGSESSPRAPFSCDWSDPPGVTWLEQVRAHTHKIKNAIRTKIIHIYSTYFFWTKMRQSVHPYVRPLRSPTRRRKILRKW